MVADRTEAGGEVIRPVILVSGRHLHQIAADAWQVLLDANDPPSLFRHGRQIATIERDDEDRPVITDLNLVSLRGLLDRKATWVAQTKGNQLVAARPPKDVVEDMLALGKPLPHLRGLTGTPVFAADGTLVLSPGYNRDTALYYEALGSPIPHIPEKPTAENVQRAVRLILDEWLVDFPFVDDASRVNTIVAALTPVVRPMIQGPTPLFPIDSPTPGTGKGLLAGSIGIVAFGRAPRVMTLGKSDEEIRKRITAVLRDGAPVILLDNVKRRLESESLASVLTTTDWLDRVLGKSETISLPNRGLWLATGNNIELDGEIARRAAWIRLDSRADRPWERHGFVHDPLNKWVFEHRHELVWALLILVRHWVEQGQPHWSGRVLGSFEDWCRVIGGILVAAGITGFLENREEMYRRVDAETEDWREFVACWWDEHQDTSVKTGQLYDLVQDWGLLPSLFRRARDDASDRALRTRFGIALAKARDRRYGRYFIRHVGTEGHEKGTLYRLEAAEDDVPAGLAISAPLMHICDAFKAAWESSWSEKRFEARAPSLV